MDAEIIDRTRRSLLSALEHMPVVIDKLRYRRKPISVGGCYRTLSGDHKALGVHGYFIDGNVQSLKQHFYIACKLSAASVGLEGGEGFVTYSPYLYGLLSDSPEIIDWLAHVETPELIRARNNPLWHGFHLHMLQLALRDEHEALQAKIEKAARSAKKPLRDDFATGKDFYSLLLKRDKEGLERHIQHWAKKQTGDPLVDDFLAEGSTLRAKLCWLKGIPVQIDSPLVPMELMPIQPLAHYDDVYDFLQPGWVPPSQGIVGRVSRWLKR